MVSRGSKFLWYTPPRAPDFKKSVASLSTGEVAYIEGDSNEYSGSGLDYVQQYYLFTTSGGKTARVAGPIFNYSDVPSNKPNVSSAAYVPRGSICVDSANNIHFAYIFYAGTSNQQRLCYRKATYSAGSYTWGAEQVVKAYAANVFFTSVDIDIPATSVDCPLIAAAYKSGTSSITSTVTLYNRQTGGTWVSQAINTTSSNLTVTDLSLACKIDTTSSGLPTYVLTFNPGPLVKGFTDPGDSIYTGRYTIGGAFSGNTSLVLSNLNKTLNGGYRNYFAFSVTADTYLVYGEIQTDPNKYWWTLISVSTSNAAITQIVAPRTGTHTQEKMMRPSHSLGAASLYRVGGGLYALSSFTVGGWGPVRSDILLTLTGSTWTFREPDVTKVTDSFSALIRNVYAYDSSRFTNGLSHFAIAHFLGNNNQYPYNSVWYSKSAIQTVSEISSPTENQVVPTNQISPTVKVQYRQTDGTDPQTPTYDARVQSQMSTSSAFNANLYTATQPTSEEKSYGFSAVGVKVDLSGYPLSQTTWYMRSRMIDSLGNPSAWSATRTFRVSHPAIPTNAQPTDQGVLTYLSSSSQFSWTFSDSNPTDVQTAYRLEVIDTAAQTSLYDSGKVASNATSVSIDLGSANLDRYVDWYLTLWDGEDVQGPRTAIGTVLFTGPPNLVITAPANNGDTITSALTPITWNPGVGSLKTQASWRVVVRSPDSNGLVYDSGIQQNQLTSLTLPLGNLHNNQTYTVDVMVVDSVGLGTTSTRTFMTSWTPPANIAAPIVYPGRQESLGYIGVYIDLGAADATVTQFNLYRRSLDRINTNWKLVATSLENATNWVYLDYMCPSGVLNEYMVTQIADRYGDLVESDFVSTPRTQFQSYSSNFWLMDATDTSKSCVIPTVTTHTYTDVYEKTDYVVINGGRQVEEGEHEGITGSLSSQIRPRPSGGPGTDVYNLVPNANLRWNSSGQIDRYNFIDAGQPSGIVFSEVAALPGPGNRGPKKMGFTLSKPVASTNQVTAGISATVRPAPYLNLTAGRQYNLSGWFNIPAPVAGYEIRLRIAWYGGGAAKLVEYAPLPGDLTNLSTFVVEQTVSGNDLWLRLGKVVTVPVGVDSALVSIIVVSTGSTVLAPITVYAEGLQLSIGTSIVPFFSGDDASFAVWTGVERVDAAYSPGYVSPRYVKQHLEWLRRSGHDLYLRTPFGDIWRVYVSDMDISNVAGSGTSEYVDVTLPYLQVR